MTKHKFGDIFEGNYPISQPFGARPSYYQQFGLRGHEGTDFATPTGTRITSPVDGIVVRQDFQTDYRNYGKVVVVWDPVQKVAVWFAHLSEEYVVTGQRVIKGQVLGKTGSTGNVTGPHLHFGVVESDAYGKRLNTNNGYIGFIDPAGSKIQWELGKPKEETFAKKVETLKAAVSRLKAELDSDSTSANKEQVYKDTMSKIKKIYDTGTL